MLSLVTTTSYAQSSETYFGGAFGLITGTLDDTALERQAQTAFTGVWTVRSDTSIPTGRIFLGTPVHENITLEIGYFVAGSNSAEFLRASDNSTFRLDNTLSGIDVAALFKPSGQNWFGKLGYYSATNHVSANSSAVSTTDERVKDFIFGVGYQNENKPFRLGIDTYLNSDDGNSGQNTVFFNVAYIGQLN
jgi:hypothetical protein